MLYGEKVIYETRPRILSIHPITCWISIAYLVFVVLLIVVGGLSGGNGLPALVGVGLFLGIPGLIVLAWAVSSARRTTYALTDQRAIVRKGDDFTSVAYQQIQQVEAKSKSSTVVFQLLPPPPGAAGAVTMKPVQWRGVRGAPAVAAYAMSATRFYTLLQRQKSLRQDIVTASLEDKVVCEYCRAYIPISTLDPNNPRCPKCSAPIAVAPLGM